MGWEAGDRSSLTLKAGHPDTGLPTWSPHLLLQAELQDQLSGSTSVHDRGVQGLLGHAGYSLFTLKAARGQTW